MGDEFRRFVFGAEWQNDGYSNAYAWCCDCNATVWEALDGEMRVSLLLAELRKHNEQVHA